MTNQYPWSSNTTPPIASQDDPRYETPGGAQHKVDTHVSVTGNIADRAVTQPKIAIGAVGANQIDPALLPHYGDIATNAKFEVIDEQLADIVTLTPSGGDDTTAWNTAVNSVANGGRIELTQGDYYITDGVLKSNVIINARGKVRILSDGNIFNVNSGSADVNGNITNVSISYITFEAITKVFSEHLHLVSLSGVSDITFMRCGFIGFRGDGVYLGSGAAGEERHNEGIYFQECVFDGVSKQNRNGISIIDGDGVYIDRCVFRNCTRPNMPGAIDIEPNEYVWAIIKNIHVSKCKFKNIGGNTGVINMFIPLSQSDLITPVENITIEDNAIDTTTDTQSAFAFRQHQTSIIDGSSLDLNIKVINNKAKDIASRPFSITGIKNLTLSKNEFINTKNGAITGYLATTDSCMFIKLEANTFKKCGTDDGKGLSIHSVEKVDILRNIFDDCGTSGGYGIDFNNGTSSGVRIIGCDFVSPTGRMSVAIQKEATHTFTASSNIDQQNKFNGLTNAFAANLKDPVILYAVNTYDTTKLPDSFALGSESSLVNGDTNLPSTIKQGALITTVTTLTVGFRKFITQWFYPANNDAATLADMYFRKGNTSTNDWSTWQKVTAVVTGTSAPTTGTWTLGNRVNNLTPTRMKNISHWVCITAGTPGIWMAHGTGWGTTAERPTLSSGDSGYSYFDTTLAKMIAWNGSAWIV